MNENPFFVLGLAPDASRIEVEREAQKLLGMLELGFVDAQTYATPLGPQPRTPETVRAAVAALLPSDAITMILETVPLYLLFELSLLLATISERRERRAAAALDGAAA